MTTSRTSQQFHLGLEQSTDPKPKSKEILNAIIFSAQLSAASGCVSLVSYPVTGLFLAMCSLEDLTGSWGSNLAAGNHLSKLHTSTHAVLFVQSCHQKRTSSTCFAFFFLTLSMKKSKTKQTKNQLITTLHYHQALSKSADLHGH